MAYNDSRNPLRALQKRINNKIMIRLKDGTQYKGLLKEYDSFMNIILTDVTESIKDQQDVTYPELFIRGGNILFIKPTVE